MFCSKCGAAIEYNSKFCEVCGAPQESGAPGSQPEVQNIRPETTQASYNPEQESYTQPEAAGYTPYNYAQPAPAYGGPVQTEVKPAAAKSGLWWKIAIPAVAVIGIVVAAYFIFFRPVDKMLKLNKACMKI